MNDLTPPCPSTGCDRTTTPRCRTCARCRVLRLASVHLPRELAQRIPADVSEEHAHAIERAIEGLRAAVDGVDVAVALAMGADTRVAPAPGGNDVVCGFRGMARG